MNIDNKEVTLLNEYQVFGSNIFGINSIDLLNYIGKKCAITDFAILLGACVSNEVYVDFEKSLKGRTGRYYLSSPAGGGDVYAVTNRGIKTWDNAGNRTGGVRPVLPSSAIPNISVSGMVEYGEYPQYVVSPSMESELEQAYRSGTIRKTGKTYTTDSRKWSEHALPFKAVEHEEYEYNGRKYIRAYYRNTVAYVLSNGKKYREGNYVWIEVSTLK